MRPRIVVPVTLLVLALPIAASAGMRTPGDGTLSVRDLDGYVLVQAKGGVIGRCDQCSLFVNELRGAEEISRSSPAPGASISTRTTRASASGARTSAGR